MERAGVISNSHQVVCESCGHGVEIQWTHRENNSYSLDPTPPTELVRAASPLTRDELDRGTVPVVTIGRPCPKCSTVATHNVSLLVPTPRP